MSASGCNVLARGYSPNVGWALHFDVPENWSITNPTPRGFVDVKSVALHELGHTFELDHSDVRVAVLWSNYSGGRATKLSSDDIDGIRFLYGF